MKVKLICLLAVFLFSFGHRIQAADNYIGSEVCAGCHQPQFEQWKVSDHYRSMEEATVSSVEGNFQNQSVTFHGITSRFYTKGKQYFVETLNVEGRTQTFSIPYTFGYFPLQQYLVDVGDGHLQAFDVAWDNRSLEDGGQRWFHLQLEEDISPEHPFFWQRHFQNWNTRCADCHSTKFSKNYQPEDHAYNSQWSEINVACEACHGPASNHVVQIQAGKAQPPLFGFSTNLEDLSRFSFKKDNPVAINDGAASLMQLNTCAPCHSLRSIIAAPQHGADFDDQFELRLLDESQYHADGSIEGEVFVYGSFLQSKMHGAGVTCTNCHNPHSGKLKAEGDGVCLQCHRADKFAVEAHHHHPVSSAGARCVNCHMPAKTYMGVDDRRDHGFLIPRPALSARIEAPDPCSKCHADLTQEAVFQSYAKLFGKETGDLYTQANHAARKRNAGELQQLMRLAMESTVPAIKRATLLEHGLNFPSRVTVEAIQSALSGSNPLVRRSAVVASQILGPEQRWSLLKPYVNDGSHSVRMAMAEYLADAFRVVPEADLKLLRPLMKEFEQSLSLNQDTPTGQMKSASYYLRRGNTMAAERAMRRALFIEPNYVPALINLADIHRERGDEQAAEALLTRAVRIFPDNASAQYALGLAMIRQQRLPEALAKLKLATELDAATPHIFYVYAVALENTGAIQQAINILKASNEEWPKNPNTLSLLVSFLEKANRRGEIPGYLSELAELMPNDPQVQRWQREYAL